MLAKTRRSFSSATESLRLPLTLLVACGVGSVVFGGSVAFAQSRAFDCRPSGGGSREDRSAILDKVQGAYSKVSSLSAEFSQDSFLAALDSSEPSKGRMWFLKPGRMKWHYTDPEEQLFIVRDKTVWLYQVADKQIVVDTLTDMLLTDLPVAFLMGIGDVVRDFTVRGVCEGGDGLVLDLTPKKKGGEKQEQLKSFKLLVNPDTYLPMGASVSDVGGNNTAIVFKNLQTNGKVDDTVFAAVFPKGIDVQDRRREVGVDGKG